MNVLLLASESPTTVAIIRAISSLDRLKLVAFWSGGAPIRVPSSRFSPTRRWRVQPHLEALGIAPLEVDKNNFSAAFARQMKTEKIDALISFGTHIIVPGDLIDAVEGRAFNFHPALLPHHGGPYPLQSMLFNGEADRYGGMTLHYMTSQIDGGPIVAQRHCPFDPGTDRQRYNLALADAAFELMQELPAALEKRVEGRLQDQGQRTYYPRGEIPIRVTPSMSMTDLDRFCRTIGRYFVRFAVIPFERSAPITVVGMPRRIRAPTGAAPIITRRSVEFDIADARLVLQRPTRLERLRMDLARTYHRAKTPLPD